MTTGHPRLRGDAGQVGGIEVLPLGVLTFLAVTLLVVNAWGVVDTKAAVGAAAREAVRAYVEAPDEEAAREAGRARAGETLAALGRDPERLEIVGPTLDAPFGRCSRVRVIVRYPVELRAVPFLSGARSLVTVQAAWSEVVDPFRSGVPGPVRC